MRRHLRLMQLALREDPRPVSPFMIGSGREAGPELCRAGLMRAVRVLHGSRTLNRYVLTEAGRRALAARPSREDGRDG